MRQLNVDYYEYVEDVLRPEDIHEAHHSNRAAENGIFVVLALVLTAIRLPAISGSVQRHLAYYSGVAAHCGGRHHGGCDLR